MSSFYFALTFWRAAIFLNMGMLLDVEIVERQR